MLNKYTAALLATMVYGILFPLLYQLVTQDFPQPVVVAASAALVFFGMLALFDKLLRKNAPRTT